MTLPLILGLAQQASTSAEPVQSAAKARFELWGDYSLADPAFLLLIPVVLLAVAWGRARRGRVAGRMSVLPGEELARSWAQRLGFLPRLLSVLALVAVVLGLARPLRGSVESRSVSEGVDIALLLDRSSSMQHKDLEKDRNRLEVVKEVVGDFARRRMTDRESAADNVALVKFARYPELVCPFTLDVDALSGFLDEVDLVQNQAQDGTGIGIALAKAVAVLAETDAESKVCVLLTDGQNTLDDIEPMEAAILAAEKGIRVYTVFAGRYLYRQNIFGRVEVTNQELDSSELEAIAEKTGGRFFRARSKEGLEKAYAEIEALERTPREESTYSETFDLYPRFLLVGLVLHVLSWLLASTWLRRMP